ncbi:hypothetical protein C0992_006786 [Termitomyces sp. T32_za158]|nr:hypothetical protein C0992_006786 [Termitomyces sp. T32_za158]
MSKSRSTSLTPNTLSTPNPSGSTTSRTLIQLRSPFELTPSEKESQSPPFTQVHPLPHPSQTTPSESTNSQMTRQLRLEQTVSRPSLEHSTSFYSQEYIASTSKGKGQSESTVPSPKKKRTRTLTTPHQAAVLYALLAKVYASLSGRPVINGH